MRRSIALLFQVFVFSLIMSCGSSSGTREMDDEVLRQGYNTPERFNPPSGISLDANSCKSPMIDPRNGTSLNMVSASGGYGDYEVPNEKYGVERGELLRLNCSTGEVIGIVRR